MSQITAQHDPAARAQAAALVPFDPAALATAGGGRDLPGGAWEPVTGPHLRTVRERYATNRTGCPGISYGTSRRRRADGSCLLRHYFWVNLGKTCRKFCIESLGRDEAWRRALKCRAEHEIRIREINAAILAARQQKEAA